MLFIISNYFSPPATENIAGFHKGLFGKYVSAFDYCTVHTYNTFILPALLNISGAWEAFLDKETLAMICMLGFPDN